MNEQSYKKIKLYSIATIIVAAVSIIIRTCCVLWFYDDDIGYYTRDTLPLTFNALCSLAVIFLFSIFFVLKPSDKTSDGKENNLALKISSGSCAVAFGVFFVSFVLSTSLAAENVAFDLISKISALMAIVYFAMNLFAPSVNRVAQVALGFGIIIWSVCVLAITYFDIYVQLNSPDKIILHLALVSVMAFFVSELKCFVGNIRSKVYLFSACCAVFFLGTASVPSLVNWFIGSVNGEKFGFYNVVLFAMFIYSLVRLLSFSFAEFSCKAEEQTI